MQRVTFEPHGIASEFRLKNLQPWKIAIWLMAALPTIFIFATWDSDGMQSPAAFSVRYLSLPITIGEIFIILLAMRAKFSIATAFLNLPTLAKSVMGVWALFAFLAVILSALHSSLLILTTMRYALHAIFMAACIHLATSAKGVDREHGLTVLAIGALAYVGFLAVFSLTVPDKLHFPWMLRLPTGTNVRQIGYFAAIASVAPFALLLFGRSRMLLYAVAAAILVAFVAWTGSRGAIAGLFMGIVGAAAIFGRLPKPSQALTVIASFVGGLAASLSIPNPSPEFGLVRMAGSLAQDDISSGRGFVWKSTFAEISKAPWTGYGSGSFNQNMREIYGFDFNHPHQFLLQYVYDWGLLGGAAAALLLLMLFISCWRRARLHADAAGYAAVAALCVIVAVAMIDGALFYPFSIFLALAIVSCNFINSRSHADDIPIGAVQS